MSKILKIAAVVVAVVAITVATAGIGTAPAIAASGTGLGAVAASSAVGASLFGLSVGTLTAIGAGLSIASSLLAKKPQAASAVGSPTDWKADPGASIPYWIGRTLNAGNIVHQMGYGGTKNPYQTFVTVYTGAGPIEAFQRFLLNSVAETFSGSAGGNDLNYPGFMWLTSQLGQQPESAALTPPLSLTMPGWSSSSKLSSMAATMLTLKFDEKGDVYTSGIPKLAAVGKGVRVYDPRADSTYPGGSGAQRPNNESTWAYSENPWLHALTWAIGRRSNGIRTLGVGMPVASIDVDAFVQAANVADANGWKVGGIVGSNDDKWNVLKQMCQAGGGEPVRQAALLSCFVNTPKVSLATITADDLADGDISFPAMQPRRARINSIVPTYRSEDHDWEVVAGDVVKGATYITEDGETRTRQVDYSLVQCFAGQQPVQAAQLAAYDIVNAREYGPIPLPLKPAWIRFKNGDCLTLNIPDANLVNQTAIILKRGLDPSNGSVSLTFRSETAAKHAFALGKTTTAPPTPSISAPPASPYWSDPNATRNDDGENGIMNPQLVVDTSPWVVSAGIARQAITGYPLAAWFQFGVGSGLLAIANGNTPKAINSATTLYVSSYRFIAGVGPVGVVIDYFDASGAYISGGSTYLDLAAGGTTAFTIAKGISAVPTTAVSYLAHYASSLTSGFANAGGLRVATTENGATLGAPIGSPVGTITAGDVSSTINSGGGVANGQVGTNAIVTNGVTNGTTVSGGSVVYTSFSYQNVASVTVTPASTASTYVILAEVVGYSRGTSGGVPVAAPWQIKVTNTGIVDITANADPSNTSTAATTVLDIVTGLSVATTFTLQAKLVGASTTGATITLFKIVAIELKK